MLVGTLPVSPESKGLCLAIFTVLRLLQDCFEKIKGNNTKHTNLLFPLLFDYPPHSAVFPTFPVLVPSAFQLPSFRFNLEADIESQNH